MPGPKSIACRRRRVENPDSDYPLWRITDWDDCHCVLGYLTFRLFSRDGRYLFIGSDRGGAFHLYRLDLEREEAVRITGPGGRMPDTGAPTAGQWRDANVRPGHNDAALCTERALWLVDIETLEARVLAECPKEWARFDATPQFSGDGARFSTVYELPDGRRGVAVGEVGDRPAELTSVLLHEPAENVGYLITPPTERFIISVLWGQDRQNDPTRSPAERARAWRLDPATGDCRPYLVMPPGFRATHQYFGPDGRLYFHKKTVPTWTPTWIASIDLDGGDYREHYGHETRKLGHSCVAPDGSWLVTDVQEPDRNEMIRVDLATGASEIVCWPNSTVGPHNSQLTHVHPSSDAQGRFVAFQSDRSGKCALFLSDMTV